MIEAIERVKSEREEDEENKKILVARRSTISQRLKNNKDNGAMKGSL